MLFVMILLSFLTIIAFEAGRFWFLLAKRGDSFFSAPLPNALIFFGFSSFFCSFLCPLPSLVSVFYILSYPDPGFIFFEGRDSGF